MLPSSSSTSARVIELAVASSAAATRHRCPRACTPVSCRRRLARTAARATPPELPSVPCTGFRTNPNRAARSGAPTPQGSRVVRVCARRAEGQLASPAGGVRGGGCAPQQRRATTRAWPAPARNCSRNVRLVCAVTFGGQPSSSRADHADDETSAKLDDFDFWLLSFDQPPAARR